MKLEKVEPKGYLKEVILDLKMKKLRKEVKQMKRRAFWIGVMFYVYKIIGFKCKNIKLKTK